MSEKANAGNVTGRYTFITTAEGPNKESYDFSDFLKTINKRPNVKVSGETFEAYQTAMGHYAKKEYSEAFEWFSRAADGGHSPSMHKLGIMYMHGEGVEKNQENAIEQFRRAIKNDGDIDSVYYLAIFYKVGLGVEKDEKRAFNLFLQAALSDHSESQFVVGDTYMSGTPFLKQCPEMAFLWTKAAAENHCGEAWLNLSNFYLSGIYVDKDVEKGISCLKKAAEEYNVSTACHRLAIMYRNGENVEKDEKKAFEYISKAVELNNENSMLVYAQMIIKGQGCEQDIEKGLNILENMAFEKDNDDAKLSLANNYLFIDYVKPNPQKAVSILKKVASSKDPQVAFNALFFMALIPSRYDVEEAGLTYKEVYDCMKLCEQNTSSFNDTDLGLLYMAFYNMYTNGKYLKVDETKARNYLDMAVSVGSFDAIVEITGHIFDGTLGAGKNMKAAFDSFKNLAEKNKVTPRLAERLAYCYRYGKGTAKSIKMAEQYEKIYTELTGKEIQIVEEAGE